MPGKTCLWSFGMMAVFAALALSAATLNDQREDSATALEVLTWVFIFASVAFLVIAVLSGLAWLAVAAWNYFHAVDIPPSTWYCYFWPAERKARVSGVLTRVRDSAGRVAVYAEASFSANARVASSAWIQGDGVFGPGFPQQNIDFPDEPKNGDTVSVTVTAKPDWWRGREASRTENVNVVIVDHRRTVTPTQVHDALAQLDELINEGNQISDSCGRPREQMVGAEPMYFMQHCVPRINKFARDATNKINDLCPEYLGKFQNVGNVTYGTDEKPAMIQQLERWLENIGSIEDELRKRLSPSSELAPDMEELQRQ